MVRRGILFQIFAGSNPATLYRQKCQYGTSCRIYILQPTSGKLNKEPSQDSVGFGFSCECFPAEWLPKESQQVWIGLTFFYNLHLMANSIMEMRCVLSPQLYTKIQGSIPCFSTIQLSKPVGVTTGRMNIQKLIYNVEESTG